MDTADDTFTLPLAAVEYVEYAQGVSDGVTLAEAVIGEAYVVPFVAPALPDGVAVSDREHPIRAPESGDMDHPLPTYHWYAPERPPAPDMDGI